MPPDYTIHRQIIATGREWKPCVECETVFVAGEILTAIVTGSGGTVTAWFCESCTERYFGYLLTRSWRKTWKLRRKDGHCDDIDLPDSTRGVPKIKVHRDYEMVQVHPENDRPGA